MGEGSSRPSPWIAKAMKAVVLEPSYGTNWADALIVRDRAEADFRRVAWEITERCNLRCAHCYLGVRTQKGLPLDERLAVLDKLERLGCLWLQLTGGEALADPLFEQTYRAAWERGLMISVSTNGVLLSRWIDLFRDCPPRRVTFSLYGASDASYAELTDAPSGTLEKLLNGLDAALASNIRLRASIIATKTNAHEIGAMETLLDERGVERHTYSNLIPTVRGDDGPMALETDLNCQGDKLEKSDGCAGGSLALHVHVSGRASPCKLLPHVSVDLQSENPAKIKQLALHAGTKPATPNCHGCQNAKSCTTCAPIVGLYKNVGRLPRRVCGYGAA
jgi:MoaA/NifB/PqqE/SkfB family radical SAM enzyme